MNGYEFVEKILGQTNYDVGPLLKLVNGIETEWLEFKAATKPKDEKFYKNENKWDYRLDVSKALFAMANSIGGAVLIGVGENSSKAVEPVNLKNSGFKGDKDKFILELGDHILHPRDGWRTGTEGTWECTETHDLFRPVWGLFNEQLVIIILVKPRKKEDKWLQFECKDNENLSSVVLTRRSGDRGQNNKILDNDLLRWWKNREVDQLGLDQRYQSFLEEWKILGKHSDVVVEETINSYLESFQLQYKKDNLNISFISLNAKKRNDINVVKSNQAIQSKDVLELLENNKHIVLLGDPGSGKSTCLYHKAVSKAKEWRPGEPWILFISLYEYTESGIRALLLKKLPGLYWIDIEARINSGEIILMFDALNECPTAYYDDCYQEIRGLLRDYSSARVVISSRLSHPIDISPAFEIFEICPMYYEQQQMFLKAYLGNAEKSAVLLDQLYRQPSAKLIASSPVLLKMVADIGCDGKDLPAGLAKLYHRFLEIWCEREAEKNRLNGSSPLWSFNRIREALALLSFRMRAKGKVSCSVSFARDTLEPVMGNDVARFLDRIAQGLLLIVDDQDEFLHFSHETIQEYLAAEYLVNHQDALTKDLLEDKSGKKTNNWAMPLVFAFELIHNPSKEFLQSAWIVEPMLVAAAIRDSKRLASLDISVHTDLWLRGVLRVMRGEDATAETRELSYVSHLPPKYPLPNVLVASLQGTPFWYSGQTHKEGVVRLKRVQNLIFDRSSMWVELLPHLSSGKLIKKKDISPAQQVLIGEIKGKDANTALENATVAELCTLLRYKKIPKSYFISHWEEALQKSDDTQVHLDLIALLRTNAKLGKQEQVKLSDFNNEQKAHLYKMGKNWKLSLRLLNILVRERILTVKDIRDEPGRLEDIISNTSSMNAFRFMKNGIIKQEDIPENRLREILSKMEPKFVTELKNKGFLSSQEALISRRNKKYLIAGLVKKESREYIAADITGRKWDVVVLKTFPDRNFGFVKCVSFNEDIIFWLDKIDNPNNKTLVKGDKLQVFIKTQFNNKKEIWGFIVTSGYILEKFSEPA